MMASHHASLAWADPITLVTPDARVTVTRSPFRMQFTDGVGNPVLTNVQSEAPLPAPEATVEPEPLGAQNLPDHSLYAPLAFEVGAEIAPQQPAGPWVGNIVAGGRGGIQFVAKEVLEVEQIGNRLRLVLSTNDPAGRVVNLDLAPAEHGSIEVVVRVEPSLGVSGVSSSFVLREDEAFYGFGGRHNAINQRGEEVVNYLQSQNVGAGPFQPIPDNVPGLQGESYLFPAGEHAAFYVHASFISSEGYGFLLDNFERSIFLLGSSSANAWQVAVAAPELKFLVAPGDEKEAVGKITGINGRHRVPPDFGVGFTISRTVRALSPEADDANTYEAKIRSDITKLDETNLPIRTYAFEGWDILPRETVREIIGMLHDRGIKAYLYIRSYVGLDVANTEKPDNFFEAVQRGYVATTPGGAPFLYGTTFIAGIGAAVDYTFDPAVRWFRGRLLEMVHDLGADGFMQDFGEQILHDMHFKDGSTGATMHNKYANIYHCVTRRFLDEYEASEAAQGRKIFFYTRGGYSGRPGAAACESSNFPGDETTDWSRASGLASLTTDMLSRAVGGSFGYDTDIGGFIDVHVPPTTEELFIRWAQWAALSTGGRVHNSVTNGVRMPWSFSTDGPALELFGKAAQLKLDATPLIRALWEEGQTTTGLPPTRPMWLQYPDDPEARKQDQQWMLGPDVLVAPVVVERATTREVWFPPGCWKDGESGATIRGEGAPAAYQTVSAPLSKLPYFFRCGTNPFGS